MAENKIEGLPLESWPPVPDSAQEPEAAFKPEESAPSRGAFLRIAILIALTVGFSTIAGTFSGEKLNYLQKDVLKLSAGGMATMGIVMGLGDYLRPFIGSLADVFPLFGYHRRSYYVIGSVISAASCFALALLTSYHYYTVLLILTVMGAGGTMVMIISDAVMVKIGNKTGTVGTLQSVQQFVPTALSIGGLAWLSGYVTTHWSYHKCFLVTALISLISLPLFLLIDEKKVIGGQQANESVEEHELRQKQKTEERHHTLMTLKAAVKSTELWAIVGFVFYLIFTPSINNAQFIYQTNFLHFTPQEIGNLASPGSSGTILGILVFGVASRYIPVRSVVWGAWILDCLTYVILYGIRDYASAYAITFIGGAIGIIYTLCLFTLAARACPPGIEGTVYGLVISSISLAGALGEKIGDSIFDALGGMNNLTTLHAWHESLIIGLVVTLPAVIFIPFLPKWTKSNERLKPKLETQGETA